MNRFLFLFSTALLNFSCLTDGCLEGTGKDVVEIYEFDNISEIENNDICDIVLVQDTVNLVKVLCLM